MKTIIQLAFAVALTGMIALNSAVAEDFTFKTTLTKTVAKTINPPSSTDCDGNTTTPAPINYDAIEIMTTPGDFTVVSFKVYYSDDIGGTLLNSYTSLSPATVNFNSTTGEISYTMTGIAQTRKALTAQVFLNDGSGSVFKQVEFYTSQASNTPPVGSIIPYYGADDNGAVEAQLNLGGWFFCDGTSIASISDNMLFPAEKTTLTTLIGANLPDLRGLFLRGTDPLGTYDPTASRAIGNIQSSAIQGHTHDYDKANTPTGNTSVGLNVGTTTVTDDANNQVTVVNSVSLSNDNHNHSNSYTSTATTSTGGGGTDTRPANAAVNYLIKARK